MTSREDLNKKNSPREYLLDDPAEVRRLMRECRGYLHTCHNKHGTDWEGRKFAIDALNKLSSAPAQCAPEACPYAIDGCVLENQEIGPCLCALSLHDAKPLPRERQP